MKITVTMELTQETWQAESPAPRYRDSRSGKYVRFPSEKPVEAPKTEALSPATARLLRPKGQPLTKTDIPRRRPETLQSRQAERAR